MARNILFTAGVVLVIMSLFLPWYVLNNSSEETQRDNYYESGGALKTETDSSAKYYLSHAVLKQEVEQTKYGTNSGITAGGKSNSTYSGDNDHYREQLVGLSPWGGELSSVESFLYTLYKVVMIILFLSFTIIVLEGLNSEADLSSMKIGIAFLHLIILLLFITGIKSAVLEDNGDVTMLESPNSNEYVNMTLPFGFGKTLVSNDTHLEYYTLENSSSYGYEKTVVVTTSYDNTWQEAYFLLYSGPGPDEIRWNKNNYNHSFSYENETTYYVWFDREELDANVSDRDPTPDNSDNNKYVGLRIGIDDLDEDNNSASTIRNRIIQTLDASGAPFTATANQTVDNRLSIESTYYGNQRNGNSWNYNGNVNTETDGFLDYTESMADRTLGASWYPSTGFVVSILGFVCFVGSRFED